MHRCRRPLRRAGFTCRMVDAVIDLRSDTATRPTAGMRRRSPPPSSVTSRCARIRRSTSCRSGSPSCSARSGAVPADRDDGEPDRSQAPRRPGDVLLAEEHSHVLVYEFGGAAAHAGLLTRWPAGHGGRLTPEQVSAAASTVEDVVDQRPAVLVLENTHNVAGGRVWPLAELEAVVAGGARAGLGVHMDGARLLNAAVALGVPPAAIGGRVDTVTLCLSKGLGCPLGALLAGLGRPDGARLAGEVPLRRRDAPGGRSSRRPGSTRSTTTSSGSQTTMPGRGGSARAGTRPGCRSSSSGSRRTSSRSTSRRSAVPRRRRSRRLARRGRRRSRRRTRPSHMRAVTHLDLDDDDIERALELVPAALARSRRGLSRLAACRPSDENEGIASARG